tara:strand:+ start:196 stop:759 length:564 start_codon:yes stop_codon:yes gene_type:complete
MASFETKTSKLDIDIGHINEANIEQLKVININTLPVRYSPKFYKDLLAPEGTTEFTYDPKFMRFAHYNGFAIGAIAARLEKEEDEALKGKSKLYLMIMNVLAAYRRRGVASALLSHIIKEATKDERVTELLLHVQTSNVEAKDFYLANGFEEVGIVEDYYKRIEPTSAFLLKRKNEYVPEEAKEATD